MKETSTNFDKFKEDDSNDFEVIINDRQVFCPGEKITGAVKLGTSKAMNPRSIVVKLCGQAFVRWTESNQFDSIEYINCETYLNDNRTILECDKNGKLEGLTPGDNAELPFCFVLPPSHLPSSFNHGWRNKDFAVLRYWVHAYIILNSGETLTAARDFYLKETMELNKGQHLLEPQKMSASKDVCWWCFKTGPVILQMEISRVGYYPGEDVVIRANVDATSSYVSTGKVEVQLLQRVTYIANSDYVEKLWPKSDNDNSLEREHWSLEQTILLSESIGSRRQMNWDNVRLQIPKAIVPSISCSACIQLSYFVQCKVNLRSVSDHCTIRMPIVVVWKPRVKTDCTQNVTGDELKVTE